MNKAIIDTLLDWMKKGKGYPTQVQIHLTNFCNLKCIFCPTRALVRHLDRSVELKKEDWLRIIDEGVKLGVKEWHICGGGEPMFFTEDAVEIMTKIKESGCLGEIITNGTFFTDDVAKKIVKIGWDKIYISLDSPDEKTQNYLRGVDCYKRIINGVKYLVKWKKKLKKNKPEIYFHSVICKKNFMQIPELLKLASKLDVDGVLLNALNIWKPEIKKLSLDENDKKKLLTILEESEKIAKELGVLTNVHEFKNFLFFEKANVMNRAMIEEVKNRKGKKSSDVSFDNLACYYPWYNISIFSDGNTLPCFILKDKGENVKEKSLKDIWFGEYFNKIRKTFLKNKLKEDCAKCNPWNLPMMNQIRNELSKYVD